ncbi:MAG: sugar phosphate isomerase/epimerase [Streptosporangiales bacterium]|nr:sugar phosphate isomerase/epimerase [Streptosporangiales bacterium]
MVNTPPALQLYSLREQLASGSRLDILRSLRSFGYGAVEPYDVRTDPEGQRADLDAAGLTVCSVHAKATGADAEEFFRGAKTLGADTLIVPMSGPEEFASAGAVAEFARELNETAARAADHGLRLGYHNHWFELESSVGGTTGLEALADALDPEVILEVDTYWAAVGLRDARKVPGLLERLGERVRYLHVKDGPVVDKTDVMTAVGGGRVPVADILAAAPGAEWHVVELDRCATDMLTAVRESLEWLAARHLAEPAGSGR